MNLAVSVCILGFVCAFGIVICYLVWHTRFINNLTIIGLSADLDSEIVQLKKHVHWFMYLSFIAGCMTFPVGICWLFLIVEFITKH